MRSSRDYYNEFVAAVSRLNNDSPMESQFIEALNADDFHLARIYGQEEVNKRISAAVASKALLDNFLQLKITVNHYSHNAYPNLSAPQVQNLQAAGRAAYLNGLSFMNDLLAYGKYADAQIKILNRLVLNATATMRDPESVPALAQLNNSINELNAEMETGTLKFYSYSAGRLFLGALTAVLGVGLVIAGLVTAPGLLLTLGVGLFTWGNSWGPVSWGKQLFNYGVDLASSGPTFFQRAQATQFNTQLLDLTAKVEEIQQVAPQI